MKQIIKLIMRVGACVLVKKSPVSESDMDSKVLYVKLSVLWILSDSDHDKGIDYKDSSEQFK